jgi:tetratricopeptide (TPR) repeat protein
LSALGHALKWAVSRSLRRVADAQRHMGNAYSNPQEHRAAVANYTRAIVLDPAYAYCYFSRGVLRWRELGEYEEAIRDFSTVLELRPDWADALFNRALAYKMSMRYEQAIADFEQYLEQGTDEFWLEATRRQLDELADTVAAGGEP